MSNGQTDKETKDNWLLSQAILASTLITYEMRHFLLK